MGLVDMLEEHRGAVGRTAWVMAWVALVGGQLHALSRFRTEDGKEDLELAGTAAWAEPVDDLLSPLLSWGDADLVYVTYGKLWLPVMLAILACALLVHRVRAPRGAERWVWRVVLLGYAGAAVGIALSYWTQWTGSYNALFDVAFLVTFPSILLTVLGSTLLGIVLLAKGFRPWLPALLVAATFPLALAITMVTSLGNVLLPIAFGFGLLGRRMATTADRASLPADVPAAVEGQHV
jgi:hypothetical protein